MKRYKISKEAESDLIRIHRYGVKKFGETQADAYFFAFFDHFERISDNPYQFPSADYIRTGYRYCACGVDTIYYRIVGDVVEIMTIIGRQDIDNKIFCRGQYLNTYLQS
ncbi:type II toxin-antitoxin system RelE/ParE family toxin [Galbibacter sp. EGI 63066]|uniref:type II toxin-antitoxin system RelE/ParE family toxin n=1 Tax=Galbibacter sp. EGI 63066 TaxID=2993559 RepID=UPI002248CC59|nr:type II toxin-antitoxin system RelE/ParE family toxin [Galbibacter sp. EGI 63066]MCX2681303.1 type II toxin-antitoxin system RelE/ParE family toxin [Galbibacter sp. EGI 63066]